MEKKVYIASFNTITSLGVSAEESASFIRNSRSGIEYYEDSSLSAVPFYASRVNDDLLNGLLKEKVYQELTRFEKLLLASLYEALKGTAISLNDPETVLVISTTKGNIDQLVTRTRVSLAETLKFLAQKLQLAAKPLLVSNACISGAEGIVVAKRLLQSGKFKHAVVTGADVVSEFVLSGFQSFKALASGPCRPFDKDRDGLNLGEGAATMILSTEKVHTGTAVFVAGGAVSNDANHISGPSRTGEGLFIAIKNALKEASVHLDTKDIGFISAHGTGTPYNDEMESKAFALANIEDKPVNSLKGYFGHTLGAAGLIESVIGIYGMGRNELFPSLGYNSCGTSQPLKIIKEYERSDFNAFLKTASGFGGCNAAIVFCKDGSK